MSKRWLDRRDKFRGEVRAENINLGVITLKVVFIAKDLCNQLDVNQEEVRGASLRHPNTWSWGRIGTKDTEVERELKRVLSWNT